jgi:ATP-binding cassette subfamily G (WHITE) protein 2 (SNQ2)
MEKSNVPLHHSTNRDETEGRTYESIHPKRSHVHNDDASLKTASIDDDTARNSQQYNATGFSDVQGGVNVHRAEQDFADLSKELSRTSNNARRLSRVQSRQSRKDQPVTDIEKAGVATSDASSEETFDLEKTLRGSRDEEEAAGIKSKRIGVVWDDLTVSGIGGVKNYVKVRRLCQRLVYHPRKANHSPRPFRMRLYRFSMSSQPSQVSSEWERRARSSTF